MTIDHVNGHVSIMQDALKTRSQGQPTATFSTEIDKLTEIHRSLNTEVTPEMLADIGQRTWFSPKQWNLAQIAFRGALGAAAKERRDLLILSLSAIADIYNFDRALHVTALAKQGEPPLLWDQLPTSPPGVKPEPGYYYERRDKKYTTWKAGTPWEVVPAIAIVLENEIPDMLAQITFEKHAMARSFVHADPIIYALYGDWYVRVAQWD
jgi:hypothetical protein